MNAETEAALGGVVASMALHQITLTCLLKAGLITPQQVREILDGLMLVYEQAGPTPAQAHARERVRRLLAVLEETVPEMLVTQWRRMPGGPEA